MPATANPICVVSDSRDRSVAELLVWRLREAGVPALMVFAGEERPLRHALSDVAGWESAVVLISRHNASSFWLSREMDAYHMGVSSLAGRLIWVIAPDFGGPNPGFLTLADYETGFSRLLAELGATP